MMHFHLSHIIPDPRLHGLYGYLEVIETMRWGLESLGHRVTTAVNSTAPGATNILFGFQLLDGPSLRSLPPNTIAYNLEQIINVRPDLLLPSFRDAAGHLQIWEYSPQNLPVWRSLNPACAPRLVPVAYAPILTRIPNPGQQEMDVLFYGLPSDKRLAVIRDLCLSGLRVVYACGVYGASRDELISRSKLVLNLNLYAGKPIFEVARVSYLLANAKAVVSDLYEQTYVEPDLREAIEFVPVEQITAACVRLVSDASARRALEERGLEIFRRRDIRSVLANALSR
jgi:hypothetical protein